MQVIHKQTLLTMTLLALLPTMVSAAPSAPSPIDLAQHRVTDYLVSLANIHCTETVTQQKLAANGHVDFTMVAKYDYLIMMSGSGDEFQLNESRIEESNQARKPSPTSMLVSNGIATLLLVFHPYYRDSFTFEPGASESSDGRRAIPVRFTHISGRRTPMALALRDREYPLELQGTAWIDELTGEVIRINARLDGSMSDVGLSSLEIQVSYEPVSIGISHRMIQMPSVAVVDLSTPRQHWRNTHEFSNYKSFSTEAEQDPNVKVHDGALPADSSDSQQGPPTPKENP